MWRFDNKRVLVVGGSSGIGNAIAQAFRAAGAEVTVWGTRAQASDYSGEAGSDLEGLAYAPVDVGDRDSLDRARLPEPLDVVVLCQGIVLYGRREFVREGWDQVMAVNLRSVMDCAMRCRPGLAASSGSMIIMSSVSAFRANRGNPAYAASKAATVSLTTTLAEAWATDGIRVNAVAPGLVETRMTRVTTDNPARLAATLASIPLGRAGAPAEIADAVLFLASPAATYILGHTLVVDGGLTLS